MNSARFKEKIVITGANGFIGRELMIFLSSRGRQVRAVTRYPEGEGRWESVAVGDIGPETNWELALDDASYIVHLAGRAHKVQDAAVDPLAEYRRVNVQGTITLAKEAIAAGVRRFLFISSIGVNGSSNTSPFTEADPPGPVEPYAISKVEAEKALQTLAAGTGMEVVIIRPPLVYGPYAPGNFGRLVKAVAKGVPLPFGAVPNRRSLVSVYNLVDLIAICIDHPAAANQVFLAGDGEDISTPDLLRKMGEAFGKPARLLPIPIWLLKTGAALLGKKTEIQRLCSSLQVDIRKARETLGWHPPLSLEEGLARTVSIVITCRPAA